MKDTRVIVCEDCLEGILTGVHDAYTSRYGLHHIRLEIREPEAMLFSEIVYVTADMCKAESVARSIEQKISREAFEWIRFCACSDSPEKAQAIYRFLVYGFHMGVKVMNHLADPWILKVQQLYRKVWKEQHRYFGFVRFEEVAKALLLGKIRPKHNILQLIADHFTDRFPEENWVICDVGRKLACIHPRRCHYQMVYYAETIEIFLRLKEGDMEIYDGYGDLWKSFFDSIYIKERDNPRQQMNFVPKRCWEFIPEISG